MNMTTHILHTQTFVSPPPTTTSPFIIPLSYNFQWFSLTFVSPVFILPVFLYLSAFCLLFLASGRTEFQTMEEVKRRPRVERAFSRYALTKFTLFCHFSVLLCIYFFAERFGHILMLFTYCMLDCIMIHCNNLIKL